VGVPSEDAMNARAQRVLSTIAEQPERLRYALWCLPRSLREAEKTVRLLGIYRQRGWFTSVVRRGPVDRHGRPLPWFSYPSIDWLDSVLRPEDTAFEYGMGGSTLWFADRVAHVTSVEHDGDWVKRFRLPANVSVIVAQCGGNMQHAPAGDPYVDAIRVPARRFNVIIIDGMARLSCVEAAHAAIDPAGLIVFDNTDFPYNRPAYERLVELGYVPVNFSGTRPASTLCSSTTVFSRDIARWLSRAGPPRYWGRCIAEYDWR
jgi:hypothetical protein